MDANGAFIAECNPETVLCLIDEIERLQAEIERMHDAFEDFKEYVQAGGTEYD
jgi:Holliday junction resolvasome RuvABC ATP-dependent DNA helicase subunit